MPDSLMPATPSQATQAEQGFDLREALGFVWRQWLFIAVVTAVVLAIGTVYLLRQTPLYTATTQVLLDSQKTRIPGSENSGYDYSYYYDLAMVENQMAVIRSTVLLRRVVERAHLAAKPADAAVQAGEPAAGAPSFLSALWSFVAGVIAPSRAGQHETAARPEPLAAETGPVPAREIEAIEALKGALKVTRAAQEGHVLAISVTSPDPAQAARLANAVAEGYLVDKLDTRFEAAKRASTWLSDRLVGLRKQLQESEEAVAQFRAVHGLVQSGGTTLNQQQLSELNAKLIEARAELAQKKARVGLLDTLQARGGSLQNMPDITNSGALPSLRQQASLLSAQEADLLARYGVSHPLVVNIRAQLRDVDRTIAGETGRLAASLRNDFELARARVASLEKSLEAATGQSNLDETVTIRLRELERTAAVNKTLFEDFLKQAKVTSEQSTFEPQEIRVITPALPPGAPTYPRSERFLAFNLLVGLLAGVGGAFAKEKLNSGFTTPKQIEDMLGLPFLASVSRASGRDLRADRSVLPVHQLAVAKPLSRHSEAMRSLRSGVHMTDVDDPPKVIQVTSAVPREGKTTIALSLAGSAAGSRLKVLFIDADLRHPSATRAFGSQDEPGLVDLLVGDADLDTVVRFFEPGGFWTIGTGSKTQNPTDLLSSERLKRLIAGFKTEYDLVVIDTPPAGPVIDPVIVSHLCDKVVLVVRWGATAREVIKQCVGQLSGHRKIAGVVFNLVNDRQAQKYGRHAYSYYYGSRHYKSYYGQ